MIPDGRGPNTAGTPGVLQRELGRPGQAVSDLPPVHQVLAVKNGYTRKILKAAGNQIIILAYAAKAGIGMKARYYGVFVLHGQILSF